MRQELRHVRHVAKAQMLLEVVGLKEVDALLRDLLVKLLQRIESLICHE